MYVRNRTQNANETVGGGHSPYGVASHLRAFGASCAVVEPMEQLRKLGSRATFFLFVGYEYGAGE